MSGPLGASLLLRRVRQSQPHEFVARFVFGGLVAAAAGIVATTFSPGVGGLFLAFPALLPASLTLIAKHSRTNRAAGADALGAAFGSLGLLGFGLVVWRLAEESPAWLTLGLALLTWVLVAGGSWAVFESARRQTRRARRAASRQTARPGGA
jgi:Protein of unknown function (DUF3147)